MNEAKSTWTPQLRSELMALSERESAIQDVKVPTAAPDVR